MNVAFHLTNFGLSSRMLSSVGQDELGKDLTLFLKNKGVDTSLLQVDPKHATGTVTVQLNEQGTPAYTIIESVAWDFIKISEQNQKAVATADVFVFGSLAARNKESCATLRQLLQKANYKVFDVNLRPPFFNQSLLEDFLGIADMVKMNDEELELIGKWYFSVIRPSDLARLVKEKFGIKILIVTRGGKGAFALDKQSSLFEVPAKKIRIMDTIGSGDSFLAGFLFQFLLGAPLPDCLGFAARTGALVASRKGGTPEIDEDMVRAL